MAVGIGASHVVIVWHAPVSLATLAAKVALAGVALTAMAALLRLPLHRMSLRRLVT
jgi:hypothetical protein